MRRLIWVWAVLAIGCRPKPAPSTHSADSAAAGSAADDERVDRSEQLRFARPISSVRVRDRIAVAARDRTGRRAVLALLQEKTPNAIESMALPDLRDAELVTSSGALGLLGRVGADGEDDRVLHRIGKIDDAGAAVGEARAIGSAACASGGGLYSLGREGKGWKGTFRSLGSAQIDRDGPRVAPASEATLVCGEHRAFVVTRSQADLHAWSWDLIDRDARPKLLPKAPASGAEGELLMGAMGDHLVVLQLGKGEIHSLVWPSEPTAGWRKTATTTSEELAFEAMEAADGAIGVLTIRTIRPSRGCREGALDSVAQVGVLEASSGLWVHDLEEVETWRCGAEPGPFFAGWAKKKFVVAWPRGADAACARAGVRHGGIGFAEVERGASRARLGQVAKPAEALAEGGCDGDRCFAVALTRGADPCGSAESSDAGQLEVIAYP